MKLITITLQVLIILTTLLHLELSYSHLNAAEMPPTTAEYNTAAAFPTPVNSGFTAFGDRVSTGVSSGVTISVNAPTTVIGGGTFWVIINVNNVANLNASQFDLSYNPAVIQVNGDENTVGITNGVTNGRIPDTLAADNYLQAGWTFQPSPGIPSGNIRIWGHMAGTTSVTGSGYLVKINFAVLGTGGTSSNITLSNLGMYSSNSVQIVPDTITNSSTTVWFGITTTSPLPNGEIGIAYAKTLAASGGTLPYSWSIESGTLPLGLSFNSSGLIYGIPTLSGSPRTITFKVIDGVGKIAIADLAITIVPSPSIVTSSPLPNGEQTAPYSSSLTVSGGVPPFLWSITSGNLPNGLSLDLSGSITGVPTASGGPTLFTCNVTDHVDGSASANLSITIIPGPSVTTLGLLAVGEIAVPYSQNLTASSGTPPYSWSIQSGTIPDGLSLTSIGIIAGTPTGSSGSKTFTLKATDSIGGYDAKSVSITILPTPVITTLSTLRSGDIGVFYSQNLTVSGGLAPFIWSVQSGSLPSGLVLNPSGVITGTPTTSINSTAIVFKVVDSLGGTITKSLSITIMTAPIITTSSVLAGGEVGIFYTQTLSVSGGTSPYVWSISSGTLPDGLLLNSSGIISGTPTVPGGPMGIVLRVTDDAGGIAAKALSITIISAPMITTNSPLPDGKLGAVYSQNLTVSGGTGPYIWSIQSGAPPSGLSLYSTGQITGTPAVKGAFTFNVTVTDSFIPPVSANKVMTITITDASGVNVTLNVMLQGGSRPDPGWVIPLTVKFFTPGADVMASTPVYSFTQNTSKSSSVAITQTNGVTSGIYDITANSTTTLCNVKRNMVIATPSTDVVLGTLLEGNANGNNIINILDFGILAASYGKTSGQTGFDTRADFDRNGIINIADFGLLAANYGKFSPVPVPWTATISADKSDFEVYQTGIAGGSQTLNDWGVGDTGGGSPNLGRRALIKFPLEGLSKIQSAQLELTLAESRKDQYPAPGFISDNPPFINPGLGDTVVIHVLDYGLPNANAYSAESIGNDPGIIIPFTTQPDRVVTIDVTAAVRQSIEEKASFAAFRIQTVIVTDNDSLNDVWFFFSADNTDESIRPIIKVII